MLVQPHKVMEHAALVTYTGSAGTFVFWGLHINEIAIIVSAAASVVGVALQVYVAITKIALMRRSARWSMEHRHDGKRKEGD